MRVKTSSRPPRIVSRKQAGVALKFIEALESASFVLANRPYIGSPRYAYELNIPGLRHHKLGGYPWLVLYLARADRIDIVCVLDSRRNIPATLQNQGTD